MRYQDPILLAEAAGTTDLLIGGRLELALATGANGAFDAIFGAVETDARTEAKRRQSRFPRRHLRGCAAHVTDKDKGAAAGAELRVTPHSPTLRSRIRQGSSSIASAIQAAELGIGLICGTVLHDQEDGESFGQYQARIIEAYRSHWLRLWKTPPPPVAVAASILVSTTPNSVRPMQPMTSSAARQASAHPARRARCRLPPHRRARLFLLSFKASRMR